MKITVIIPTYRPQSYLYECVNSILAQSLSHDEFEIIIVLNGDKAPYYHQIIDYIHTYGNNGIIRLYYTEKKGVSNARNVGIDASNGEYICFIDDDDIISESYLEELYKCASKEYVALSNIYSFHENISEYGNEFFVSNYLPQKKFDIEKSSNFKNRSYLSFPVGKLFHKTIIGARRYDTRFANGEDALFVKSLTDRIKGIRCTSEKAIYFVRLRKGSASRKKLSLSKLLRNGYLIIKQHFMNYKSNPRGYSALLILATIPGVIKNIYVLSKNK